ncbi:MAG: 3-dehydroquinate dehydratase, partial [Rickettsiales bacterium]
NPFKRESFRQISFISSVVTGIVSGFGTDVYKIAIQALALKMGN